jgi:hypothetical protein
MMKELECMHDIGYCTTRQKVGHHDFDRMTLIRWGESGNRAELHTNQAIVIGAHRREDVGLRLWKPSRA